MSPRRFNPITFVGDLMIANMQMSTVLWHRLSSPQSKAERSRMITEKVAATSSGAFEVQKAALRMSRDIALGKSPNSSAALELAEAGMKPALKTMKANAKRLSKPRKKR